MVRLINLQSCLRKICPELSRRLKRSELAVYSGSLSITYPESSATLAINKGKVTLDGKSAGKSGITGGHEVAQLLMGTDSPLETCEAGKMALTGEAARLVQVLFPNESPQLHDLDRY